MTYQFLGHGRHPLGGSLGILPVLVGQLANRVRRDTLLYIAGFVGMGICFSIGRVYADPSLKARYVTPSWSSR